MDPKTALRDAIDNLITRLSETYAIAQIQFMPWREHVLQRCLEALKRKPKCSRPARHKVFEMTSAMRKYLRYLHKYLVLVPIDKAANNVAFVCKRLYVKELRAELLRPFGAYESWNETPEQIISRHKNYLSYCKLTGQDRLPYLYWMPKMHKAGKRFIAGSPTCTTREASSVMSDVLQLILRSLREKDDSGLCETGIRRYFVVNGYEEVVSFLHGWPRVSVLRRSRPSSSVDRRLFTGDFSTMYTTIPHTDLKQRLGQVCSEAWEWVASHRFHCSADELRITWTRWDCQWERTSVAESHTAQLHQFKRTSVKSLLSFLIDNTFLLNGGVIRRQRLGIPMGTNNAPAEANAYLYSYESEYIDRLAKRNPQQARAFHMSFRLIDDVLSIDNSAIVRAIRRPAEEGGLYPRALQLNDTSVSATEVQFLGMRISDCSTGALHVEVFDKRKEFPFAVRRYPHMDSLIPASLPYGVFMGQLHRFYRICSQWKAFLNTTAELGKTLIEQGCLVSRIRRCFHAFLVKKKHVRWHHSIGKLYFQFSKCLGELIVARALEC